MTVLNPTVSILVASHMKPDWLPSSLESIFAQTRLDIQVVLCDSGEWIGRTDEKSLRMAAVHEQWSRHPLIEWQTLGELPGLLGRVCPHSYVMNRILESGAVRGRYVCVFTDDDLYAPDFIATMAGFLDQNPGHQAVYCSQDRIRAHEGGRVVSASPTLMAHNPRGPGEFDQLVDMLQIMFHRSLLDQIDRPWFNEDVDPRCCRHSDGQFMERIAEAVGTVPNILDILVTHRYTPDSHYN